MQVAIRYFTETGHTKKLGERLGGAIGVEAKPLTEPVDEKVDILFLGSSYYAFGIAKEVKDFISKLDKEKVGKIVVFGSAAMLNSTIKKVKKEAEKVGIEVDDREFHCKGEYKAFNKGRPNEDDFKAIEKFGQEILGK